MITPSANRIKMESAIGGGEDEPANVERWRVVRRYG